MQQSALQNSTTRVSPIEQAQMIKFGGESKNRKRPELHLALPLTSLIDAFSIIVIYLLIGTQSGGLEVNMPAGLALPTSQTSATIEHEAPIVRVENGRYFINDKQVAVANLGTELAELKKNMNTQDGAEILIQADTKMDYADLDPLLRAGSEAGIQKLKFAVLPNK